jgi:dephospho-CoA kinase
LARLFAEHGATVLDADAIGHALLDQRPAREEVVKHFGTRMLEPKELESAQPRVNRLALGALVFADRKALRELEAILHPRMRRTFERAISRAARGGKNPAVVLDAAVLFEAGWHDLCDAVVFVDAPREERLKRLRLQRGWDDVQLEARERAQLPLEEKRRRADHVLTNQSDPEALRTAADSLWTQLTQVDGAPVHNPKAAPTKRAASPRGRPS